MRLLLTWLLGVPALVVAMTLVSQAVGCRNLQAGQSGQASSRCVVLAPSTRVR